MGSQRVGHDLATKPTMGQEPTIRPNCKVSQSPGRVGEGLLTLRTLSFSRGWKFKRACVTAAHPAPESAHTSSRLHSQPVNLVPARLWPLKTSYFLRMKKKECFVLWNKEFVVEICSWGALSRWLIPSPLIINFSQMKSESKTLATLKGVRVNKTLREWGFLTILNDVLVICCYITN